jgi:uncharacterized membrane protein (UPF0127 family)
MKAAPRRDSPGVLAAVKVDIALTAAAPPNSQAVNAAASEIMRTRPSSLPARMAVPFNSRAIAGLLIVAAVASTNLPNKTPRIITIAAPSGTVDVELADSSTLRARGLSRRPTLSTGGLLLVWPESGSHPVWMRDMEFPLDLIWCDSKGRVLAVKATVPPCEIGTPCPIHGSSIQDSKSVLELRNGDAKRLQIRGGAILDIRLAAGELRATARRLNLPSSANEEVLPHP